LLQNQQYVSVATPRFILAARMHYFLASPQASRKKALIVRVPLQGAPKENFMNRNLIGTLSLVALSLFNTTGAYAQAAAKADVPFAFQVGSAQLPAGCYEVQKGSLNSIVVRNCNTKDAALSTIWRDEPSNGHARLVFQHVGGQYFLQEIYGDTGTAAMVVPVSKAQKEVLLASAKSKTSEKVAIALK
jgi:hypothetical protein